MSDHGWAVMIMKSSGLGWQEHARFDSLDEAEAEKMRLELSWPSPEHVLIEEKRQSAGQDDEAGHD